LDYGGCPNEEIDKKKSDINVGKKALKEETKPKGLTFGVLLFTQKKTEMIKTLWLWVLIFLVLFCVLWSLFKDVFTL